MRWRREPVYSFLERYSREILDPGTAPRGQQRSRKAADRKTVLAVQALVGLSCCCGRFRLARWKTAVRGVRRVVWAVGIAVRKKKNEAAL